MAIIRWDPVSSMLRWPNIWEDEDFGLSATGPENLDVYETKDEVVIKALHSHLKRTTLLFK